MPCLSSVGYTDIKDMGKSKKSSSTDKPATHRSKKPSSSEHTVQKTGKAVNSAAVKKRKKYRGKKKKSEVSIVASVFPPKLKSLPSESTAISSNWKALKQGITSRPDKAKPKTQPRSGQKRKFCTEVNESVKSAKGADDAVKKSEKGADDPDVWFDDVDACLIEQRHADTSSSTEKNSQTSSLVKQNSFTGLTKILGIDCEMVGVGRDGSDSILARVSIVNHFGNEIYDTFVKPREHVTDYRTAVSGVRPNDLIDAPEFLEVQQKVSDILQRRIVVGHAVHHDLKVLMLNHPRKLIRDTSKYKPFKAQNGGRTPSLKKLCEKFIGVKVQTGEHSSVQDAQAAVRLYTMVRNQWEESINEKHRAKFSDANKAKPAAALNNKSADISRIQDSLAHRKTSKKLYVDSDDDD